MKKWAIMCGVVLLFSVAAKAQDNAKVTVFGGYSYLMYRPNVPSIASRINFNGGIGSVAFNLNSWIGVVGEVGGYHAGTLKSNTGVVCSGCTLNGYTYLFGPKIYMSSGKIAPFAQVLFGGVHASPGGTLPAAGVTSQNAFAMALGGGLDWNATPHIGVRLGQIDYLMTRFSNSTSTGIGGGGTGMQNNFRYSAGVTFRF